MNFVVQIRAHSTITLSLVGFYYARIAVLCDGIPLFSNFQHQASTYNEHSRM